MPILKLTDVNRAYSSDFREPFLRHRFTSPKPANARSKALIDVLGHNSSMASLELGEHYLYVMETYSGKRGTGGGLSRDVYVFTVNDQVSVGDVLFE
jgi:hypothetical protein